MSSQAREDVFIKADMFKCQSRIPTNGRNEVISHQDPTCTHKLFDFLSPSLSLSLSLFLSLSLSLSLFDTTLVVSRRNKENKLYFLYTSVHHLSQLSSPATVCDVVGSSQGAVCSMSSDFQLFQTPY